MSITMTATWRRLISEEMEAHGESFVSVVSSTLTGKQLDVEFDHRDGGEEGVPFTVWTEKRVYFPVYYDGAEWCGSVSRHPDGKATKHVGGFY